MARRIETKSRSVTYNTDQNERDYPFTFGLTDPSHIFVYVDGVELPPAGFEVQNSDTVVLTAPADPGSTIEIVRVTTPGDPITPTDITYMIEEAFDAFVFQDGHGRALLTLPANGSKSALFTNSLPSSDLEKPQFVFPVIQLLPDGKLVADPDGINTGGFYQAALRFEHRVPEVVLPQSMTAGGWFSVVIENPASEEELPNNKSYYAFRFLCKGYQTARDPYDMQNVAINPVAETAAGVVAGNAQSIVAEARHEPAQATLTIGTGDSELVFTAQGSEQARGEAGNLIYIRILTPAGTGSVDVIADQPNDGDTLIRITPKPGEATADKIAAQVDDDMEANTLVAVTAGGNGPVGPIAATALGGGMVTDGKLVGNQTVLTPRGKDPGPGYSNENGGIVIPEDAFTSYGHTVNSNGYHPGLGAFYCKGKPEPGEAAEEGWYNAYIADDRIKSRFIWMPGLCAIEVPGFYVDKGTPEVPDVRTHNSMRMGLGTDEPDAPLHIRTAVADDPETPEIILDNANAYDAGDNPEVARITMKGISAGDPKPMVALAGTITNAPEPNENAKLSISVAQGGALTPHWHFGGGLWSEGLIDKGPGTVNAIGYYVGGTKALYADAATPSALKLRVGNPQSKTIVGDAIDYVATNMTLDPETGMTDELKTINGGTPGDIAILRAAQTNRTITVKDGAGNINCGADRALSGKQSTLTLMYTQSEGWVSIAYQAN